MDLPHRTGQDMRHDNFRALVGTNQHLKQRFAGICKQVAREAKARFGVDLTPDDVMESLEARTVTYGNAAVDIEQTLQELEGVPAMREHRAQQAVLQRLKEGDAAVADALPKNPADRIAFARKHGLNGPSETKQRILSDDEISRMSPAMRIAAVRARQAAGEGEV